MARPPRILAIAGSLREGSLNRRLLGAAANLAEEAGVEVEILDPDQIRELPHFDADIEEREIPAVEAWRAAIGDAEALLIATPEYNATIPGALKNAVDWASRPRSDAALANKPVAVIGASPGRFGAVFSQADLRRSLGSAGARVLEAELALSRAHDAFDDDGTLADPEREEALREVLSALAAEVAERELSSAAA